MINPSTHKLAANSGFFRTMSYDGISLTKAINNLPSPKWALEAFEKTWIGVDVVFDVYDSVRNDVGFGGTVVGTGLTVAKDIGMIYASKGIMWGFTAIGTAICPGAGTAIGFGVGLVVTIGVNIFVGGWLDDQIDKFVDWLF